MFLPRQGTGLVTGTGVLGNHPFQNRLGMGGMICGRLRQPVMRSLGVEGAGATQGTREYGGGTGKGMVQEGGDGESMG